MSQENVEIVRDVMESFVADEIKWDRLDVEIEVHDHDIMDAGEYRGHDDYNYKQQALTAVGPAG